MKKMVELQDDKIIFDKDFFNRSFVDHSIVIRKAFSSITLRLMFILIQRLSFYEERKLPPRSELAKKLGVSTTSINDSLAILENAGFINRYINKGIEGMVVVDESKEEHKKDLNSIEKQKEINRKGKGFSDYFQLNYNFNKTEEEINSEIYKSLREHLDPNLTNEELKNLLDNYLTTKNQRTF